MTQLQRLVITPAQRRDQQILLTYEQRHYLNRVLRLEAGDRFIALDGQGGAWLASLVQSLGTPTELQAEILEELAVQTELPISVILSAALPKGSGFDEVVRQATEIGVSGIVPLISDRTLLKPSPQKLERWRRIAQEAAEQSERQFVPTLAEPISFAASLQTQEQESWVKYICVERGDVPHLLDCLQQQKQTAPGNSPIPYLVAVGPEGGWTAAEVEQAIAAHYQPVSLGRRILRAVTAPLVALALIAAVYEAGDENKK